MKNEKARTMICPYLSSNEVKLCVAEECMAWQKNEIGIGEPNKYGVYSCFKYSDSEGYCVMIGRISDKKN